MLFNSYEFVFGFLPVCLFLFFFLGRRLGLEGALVLLSLCSLGFYSYWNPLYLPLIVGSIAVNLFLTGRLSRTAGGSEHQRKLWLAIGLVFNLGLLGYFKYANFAVDTWNFLGGAPVQLEKIALPLAISFFTFQQVSCVVDAYRHPGLSQRLVPYSFFVVFFPQLIAGPIVLHDEIIPQLKKRILRINAQNISVGLTLFAFGLFKKVVLADNIAKFSSPIFDALPNGIQPGVAEAWLAIFAYSLQLYFDFSGYSDMAIGLGRLFNLKLPANFDSPYKATSVGEFWRRWHVTLSRFLREYLYIPLGGNRGSSLRVSFNLFLTMLLGGLWHGAGWGFVLWGAVNGVFLVIYRLYKGHTKNEKPVRSESVSRLLREISITVTFFLIMVSRVSFRAPDWDSTLLMYRSMLGLIAEAQAPAVDFGRGLLLCGFAYLACRVLPNSQEILAEEDPVISKVEPRAIRFRPTPLWAVVVSLTLLASFLSFGEVSEFLYFQF